MASNPVVKQAEKFVTNDTVIAHGPDDFEGKIGRILNPCDYHNGSGAPVCTVIWTGTSHVSSMDQSWLSKLTKLHKALL